MMQELRTERLRLRPLIIDDFDLVSELESGNSHRDFLGYVDNPASRRRRLQSDIDRHAKLGYGLLGIELTIGGQRSIGYCGIVNSDLEQGQDVEIICSLLEPYWNQRIGTEACTRVLAWGFDDPKRIRILARVAAGNESSSRLVERLGMSRFCEHLTQRQEVVYSIVRAGG